MLIDTTFDVRTDAGGRDPDKYSPTLRRSHQLLWSKPLSTGHRFDLDTTTPRSHLRHRSALGEFFLSSDQVIAIYRYRKGLVRQLRWADVRRFQTISSTIGMMIFPSNRVDGKPTMNGARGLNRFTIADRIDLTVECIRRFYAATSPPRSARPWHATQISSPSSMTSNSRSAARLPRPRRVPRLGHYCRRCCSSLRKKCISRS